MISLIGKTVFGIEWLDMVGLSIILIGFVLAKNDYIEGNDDYGKYIYYTVLILFFVLFLVMVFTLIVNFVGQIQ